MAGRGSPRARPRRLGPHRPRRRSRLLQRLRRARAPAGRPGAGPRRRRLHGRRRLRRGALVGAPLEVAGPPHPGVGSPAGSPSSASTASPGTAGASASSPARSRAPRRRGRPPRPRQLDLGGAVDGRHAPGGPRGDGRRPRHRLGHLDRAQLRRAARRVARRAGPERVERAVLLDPAMHVDPAVATERAEGLRGDVSFASPRRGDRHPPRRRDADEHAALDPRGRGRTRSSTRARTAAGAGGSRPPR